MAVKFLMTVFDYKEFQRKQQAQSAKAVRQHEIARATFRFKNHKLTKEERDSVEAATILERFDFKHLARVRLELALRKNFKS